MAELEVFHETGCLKRFNFITCFGLNSAFKEITKLLNILITIPNHKLNVFFNFKDTSYLRNSIRNIT